MTDIQALAQQVADLTQADRSAFEKQVGEILVARHQEENRKAAEAQGGGFRCGSRDSNPVADRQWPGADHWKTMPNGDRVCSFCGSLHPDDAISALEAYVEKGEGRFDVTGKGYKFYVSRAGVSNASGGGIKFYTWHLDGLDDEKQKALCDLYDKAVVRLRGRLRLVEQQITKNG